MSINTIFCVGRNYRAHAAELNNAVPTEPLIFTKPSQAAVMIDEATALNLPKNQGAVHYETELVVRMKSKYDPSKPLNELIESIGLGLDLTLRDVQTIAKQKGLPWLNAKGFKHSAILTREIPFTSIADWSKLSFSLEKNGVLAQIGYVHDMIFSLETLLAYLDQHFGLEKDDLIFTGTPEGVGPINADDHFTLRLNDQVLGSCVAKF